MEKSEFNGSFCKSRMVVQHMVAAVVVMLASSVGAVVAAVPKVCKSRHGFRFLLIQGFQKSRINRSAISVWCGIKKVDILFSRIS